MVMSRNERVATRYKLQPWDLNLNSPLERRESPWKGKKKRGEREIARSDYFSRSIANTRAKIPF